MKKIIVFAFLCMFVNTTKAIIHKERDNGFLWHYKYINERHEGDDIFLTCREPGADRCRPAGIAISLSDKMDAAEVAIDNAISSGITSGTFDYPDIEYYVVWSATTEDINETWYTYDEAIALGLI